MDTPPTPLPGRPSGPDSREAQLRLLAEDMEKAFNANGNRTLTDPETASVYMLTLGLVDHALKGSVATGIISEEQRAELDVLISGLKEAPRLV